MSDNRDPLAQAIASAMGPLAPAAAPAPEIAKTAPTPTVSAAAPTRSETVAWRWVHASVRGGAHVESGLPCQDASATADIDHVDGPVLVLIAADGAGSARCAERGSRLVCDEVIAAVTRWLASHEPANMDAGTAAQWLGEVRSALRAAAAAAGDQPRDWASTLVAAVLHGGRGLFFQIGDGAVVADGETAAGTDTASAAQDAAETMGDPLPTAAATPPASAPAPGPWTPVFWPDSGEYANCTYFVSDDDAGAHLRCAIRTGVTEAALFSDGLHAVALHHASRSAFAPFFTPLFARLRREAGGAATTLVPALGDLLDSPGVRKRSDDDRTLVLATRLA